MGRPEEMAADTEEIPDHHCDIVTLNLTKLRIESHYRALSIVPDPETR